MILLRTHRTYTNEMKKRMIFYKCTKSMLKENIQSLPSIFFLSLLFEVCEVIAKVRAKTPEGITCILPPSITFTTIYYTYYHCAMIDFKSSTLVGKFMRAMFEHQSLFGVERIEPVNK